MAKFDLRRITKEDFPSKYSDLLGKLLLPLNSAIESLRLGLSNGLTVGENMAAQETVIRVTAPVNSSSPVYFKSTLRGPCKGIVCIDAQPATAQSKLATSQPFFTQEMSGDQIKVTNITGLVDGSSYNLRIYCFS